MSYKYNGNAKSSWLHAELLEHRIVLQDKDECKLIPFPPRNTGCNFFFLCNFQGSRNTAMHRLYNIGLRSI